MREFCLGNASLKEALCWIVPEEVHEAVGLSADGWVDRICGSESRFARVESEVCSDFARMEELRQALFTKRQSTGRVEARMRTVSRERTLNFLSRKAVIPKYGFPVDVVELDTQSPNSGGVSLQRDLSQAIAEYAPGARVVANKLEWASYGVKKVAGREWPVRHYQYDDARSFTQWEEGDPSVPEGARKYLIPEFGFVTAWSNKAVQPQGRAQRFYTTRPFFRGFNRGDRPLTQTILGVEVTQAMPGTLVILCEGKNRSGFYICRSCGAHATKPKKAHRTASNMECSGTWSSFSLGHELVTDVVRLKFPGVADEWHAYSLGYAVLLGASEGLDVPNTDLKRNDHGGGQLGRSGDRVVRRGAGRCRVGGAVGGSERVVARTRSGAAARRGLVRLRLELLRLPAKLPEPVRAPVPESPARGTDVGSVGGSVRSAGVRGVESAAKRTTGAGWCAA